jgi:signal peptidase I
MVTGLSALALLLAAQIVFLLIPSALILSYSHVLRPLSYAVALIVVCVFYGRNRRPVLKKQLSIMLAGLGVGFYFGGLLVGGLIFGFARNGMFSGFFTIIYHVWVYGAVAIMAEILRFKLVKASFGVGRINRHNMAILLTLVYTFADLDALRGFMSLGTMSVADFFFGSVVSALALNVVLTYIAYDGALPALILLRGTYSLTPVFLPILPNVSSVAWSVIECFLLLLTFSVYRLGMTGQRGRLAILLKRKARHQKKSVVSYITVAILAALLIAFNLRAFNYFPVVVITDSMTGEIDRGSIVFVEKLKQENVLTSVNVGDVIHYKHETIEIMHRVVEFGYSVGGERVYITKGDANPTVDAFPVEMAQVIGVSRSFIPYAGYPVVWLGMILK